MVRGYQRQVVFLKNTESPLFEEAYFLLRDGKGGEQRYGDLIDEAKRIIAENISGSAKKRGFFHRLGHIVKGYAIPFLIGGVLGAGVALMICLL